ncbi:zingipain-2-like [Daphnia pulicaria]|uniref:zingipain-2-like n=1 Tax=Daphnia pulicaria TaxID=35523 RepID=UPI001EEBEDF1|nr:zingipain-2-like [Daphnia pulicaria]
MAKSFCVLTLVLICGAINIQASDDMEAAWKKYQDEFPLGVQTKAELGIRKSIFEETHAKITEHNSKTNATYKMGHNAFSVMTEDEQQSYFGALEPVPPSNLPGLFSERQLSRVDYRTDSCMPPVRNQGRCGSCWAHSATAVVEFGKCKKQGGKSLDFSEQQIIDCSRANGCSGGWEHEAWQYLASNCGQTDEKSYPYTAKAGDCKFSTRNMTIGAQISSSNPVRWVPAGDTKAMMSILSGKRILSIYMQLPDSFMNYKSGVFNDNNCVPRRAHAMNIVGYGTQNSVNYWVVRNSWGNKWGAAGYVLVQRGVDLCMIERCVRTANVI